MTRLVALILICSLTISACTPTIPKDALQLDPKSLEQRQRQTRMFQTTDEGKILAASAAVLQDLGFNLDESETKLGLVVGSKDRDATETGQVVGAIFIALLVGANAAVWETHQKIRLSIVTRPAEGDRVAVRVTFQRIVWNNKNAVSRVEGLDDPQLYTEFYEKLGKSVFLTAQEL